MRLVSMLTENYVERARPFLHTVGRLSDIRHCIVCLEFSHESMQRRYAFPHFFSMPRHWSESSLGILQHGRWLDALWDALDDEVYLLSDADIVVQRDFTPEERERFESCGENSFLAGWNAGEGDNLLREAERISLSPKANNLMVSDTAWSIIPCFNTGILAMRGRNWKRLRDLYESRCERFYVLTSHRSRGQWLMNWCLHRLGLTPGILPGAVHSHGHMGVPKEVTIRDGVAYYRDKVVLFRHAL